MIKLTLKETERRIDDRLARADEGRGVKMRKGALRREFAQLAIELQQEVAADIWLQTGDRRLREYITARYLRIPGHRVYVAGIGELGTAGETAAMRAAGR